ncbi:MAG: efflux RND transporter periplasmic adaptor subunit [Nitrospiraceae bacterium]|nr:efflux RND transporter periplasmic adaptor subunit [Nitrospiraceae bacterium]
MKKNAGKKSKVIILLLVIFAAGAVLLALRPGRKETVPPIRVTGIMDGYEVNLAPKIAGRISWLGPREGDAVKEGQAVITLDSEDIKASLAQAMAAQNKAEADIRAAVAQVQNSKAAILSADADAKSAAADVDMALAQRDESMKDAKRAEDLYKKGFISTQSRDQSVSASDVNKAAYSSSIAKLASARAKKEAAATGYNAALSQLDSSKAMLKEAQANVSYYRSKLDDTVIKTPVAGTVIFKAHEQGETVSPGDTILTVVDLNGLYARVDIDETKIGRVELNAPAYITVDGVPGKVFKGKITEIGRFAEFATQRDVIRGREDIKTFRVKVSVLNDPERILKPGMTVEVKIPPQAKTP